MASDNDETVRTDEISADIAVFVIEENVAVHSICADQFEGACVDSNLQITVIGKFEAAAAALQRETAPSIGKSNRGYKFGGKNILALEYP